MLNFDLKVADAINQLICTFDVDCSDARTRSLQLPVPYLCIVDSGILLGSSKLNQYPNWASQPLPACSTTVITYSRIDYRIATKGLWERRRRRDRPLF